MSVCVGCVALLGLGATQVKSQLSSQASALIASVQNERLNVQDRNLQEKGYYEGLLNTERFTSALWGSWRPKNWSQEDRYTRATADMYTKIMIPLADVVDRGARLRTNRWGMRDRDYDLEKPVNTYRIALLGASHVMGLGVEDDEPFEVVLEERLNREHSGGRFDRYEILNFAVTAYGLLQQVAVVQDRIVPFQPDAVFYVAHNGELERTPEKLGKWAHEGMYIPDPYLRDVLVRVGIEPGLGRSEIQRRLRPFEQELLDWGYRKIVQSCRDRGEFPVWIYLPLMGEEEASDPREVGRLTQSAREAGFFTMSLDGVYDRYATADLAVAPWDKHPNAIGHQIVAERLYEQLLAYDDQLGIGLSHADADRDDEDAVTINQ